MLSAKRWPPSGCPSVGVIKTSASCPGQRELGFLHHHVADLDLVAADGVGRLQVAQTPARLGPERLVGVDHPGVQEHLPPILVLLVGEPDLARRQIPALLRYRILVMDHTFKGAIHVDGAMDQGLISQGTSRGRALGRRLTGRRLAGDRSTCGA